MNNMKNGNQKPITLYHTLFEKQYGHKVYFFSATSIIIYQDKSKKTRDFGAYSIPKARCVIRLGTDSCWRRWSTPTGRPAMWNVREINSIMEYMRINQDTVTQFLHRA